MATSREVKRRGKAARLVAAFLGYLVLGALFVSLVPRHDALIAYGISYFFAFVGVTVGFWGVFEKAGTPGWAALIPVYSLYILFKVVGRPGWWLVLLLVPLVDIAIYVIVMVDLAKHFGRQATYAWALVLFAPIAIPLLGFGPDQYRQT